MDSIKIKTVFGKEAVSFTLKILSISEENKLRQRVFGLSESEQEIKGYELATAALSEFSTENLEVEIDGENQTLSVSEYFDQKNLVRERIAHYAFRAYLVALQPTTDFF